MKEFWLNPVISKWKYEHDKLDGDCGWMAENDNDMNRMTDYSEVSVDKRNNKKKTLWGVMRYTEI